MTSEFSQNPRYAGFNVRMLANLIDTILLFAITFPIMLISQSYGYMDHPAYIQQALLDIDNNAISQQQFFEIVMPYFIQEIPRFIGYMMVDFILVGAIFVGFWVWKNSTPGKILLKIRIVDNKTFEDPSTWQYIVRYIGMIISFIPLGIGFLLIPLNKKKRGLHDFMSGTAVIHMEPLDPEKEKRMFRYKTIFFLFIFLAFAIFLASK